VILVQRQVGERAVASDAEVFSTYDAFVFPTLGENFGRVIAESLSPSSPLSAPMRHHGPISCREEEWR